MSSPVMNTSEEALNVTEVYCNLNNFAKSYGSIHGYLSILVCIFGSVTNVLNICVLTTREMRWPTNLILTGLAVADLMVMLDYIPFAAHVYLNPDAKRTESYFSYPWAVYMYFHALFTQVCHFISCCLTVILAVWRYVAISHLHNNRLLQTVTSVPRTLLTIFLTYLWCPLVCLPLFLTHRISRKYHQLDVNRKLIPKNYSGGPTKNGSLYTIELSGNFKNVTFIVYGIVIKLAPCILLTVLSLRLVSALIETKNRRRLLLHNSGVPLVELNGQKTLTHKRNIAKEHQTDRTTRMLLTVLLLFLITEFPQAILALLSLIIGGSFAKQCYHPLGDLMDFLALTNSAINFVLYCSMSRQFRTAFKDVFRPKVCNRWLPVAQSPPELNGGTTQVTLV